MLENKRFNRALYANSPHSEANLRELYLDEEYRTQKALSELEFKMEESPSKTPHVGTILMAPERIPNLRTPYAIEVLGTPGAGKSTMINRYLEDLWLRKKRHEVHLVDEGARKIKEEHGDMRYTNPFLYSMMGGTRTYFGYIDSLRETNRGLRTIVSDRGQIDRRVFRRTLFSRGDVNPEIMRDENKFIHNLEHTPLQVGGIIMMVVRPEVTMERKVKKGPVTNMDFLPRLYEQYFRLHYEILQGKVPYRIYTCINAEEDQEIVYDRFKYAMDSTLNIHETYLAALASAFPREFDEAKNKIDKKPKKPKRAERVLSQKMGGLRVKIVGGDEMETEDDILNRPFVEVMRLEK